MSFFVVGVVSSPQLGGLSAHFGRV